ncbi:MAG: 3-phosphoshikimate 1-carboxyvinyltransferase [Actinomycetota bacterium]|nr:3-phosphoshikimate 1-carboxyvinyltransferase [Actinomycetota bacterium]
MKPLVGVPGVDFTVEDVRGTFPDELVIEPFEGPVDATIRVPGSKSITNRALIIGALADGTSTIENPLFSDDPYWLMAALTGLGLPTKADRGTGTVIVKGQRGIIPKGGVEVFVGNAGTAARFLPPVLALGEGPYLVDGVARMRERPVGDLVEAMKGLGARVGYAGEEGRFPIEVEGGGIRGGVVGVRGTRSSQFLSGLLMAAPYAEEPVVLEVEGGLVSRPYIGITLGVMKDFGVEVVDEGRDRFVVPLGVYKAGRYVVEPDASGASYFFAAAALTGGRVRVPGLGASSSQGDLGFVEVLAEMGCEAEIGANYIEVRGPERLRGVEVDMNEISDTMITLGAIAPFASSPTTIKNVAHTRTQETDRIAAVAQELTRLGIRVEEYPDGMKITPGPVSSGTVRTYDDHRMAMAFSLLGLVVPGIRIQNPSCVTKTLPDYFQRLEALRP